MSEKRFDYYYPDGELIEKGQKEFISFYSRVYHYLFRNIELEDKINCILKKDELSVEDIADILQWKIGAVKCCYKHNIVTLSRSRAKDPTIDVNRLIEIIKGSKELNDPFRDLFGNLIKVNNIGPVYAITLLFFLSNGNYPIYDRFAHIAVKMIYEGNGFNTLIEDSALKEEFDPNWKNKAVIFANYENYYHKRLDEIFSGAYKNDRNIDKALWVYGHLFSDNKTNRIRTGHQIR